jgi:hypothetical protein
VTSLKPWARGPFELLKHAEGHLDSGADFDKRMALISFDNAIEVSITSYLQLHPGQRNNRTYQKKDIEQWQSNYHTKLEFFERFITVERSETMEITRDEIVWYHDLRNQLYHSGNGMVPENDALEGIRIAALWVFSALYDANAESLLHENILPPKSEPQPQPEQLPASMVFLQSFIEFEKILRQALMIVSIPYTSASRPVGVLQMWRDFKTEFVSINTQTSFIDEWRSPLPRPEVPPETYDNIVHTALRIRNALIHGESTDRNEDELRTLAQSLDELTGYISKVARH